MNRKFQIVLTIGCCLSASTWVYAQSAPAPDSSKTKSPANAQQAPGSSQKPPASDANPFPEDTNSVPVVPTTGEPAGVPPASSDVTSGTTRLLGEDTDPIKSPDDVATGSSGSDSGFSSSLQGADDVKIPDVEKPGRHQKVAEPTHQETAAEDVNVGDYYIQRKNWKAALSRFAAASVLDPENPEVYWGMAEAQRQLGDFANAKANYLKLLDYDPDGKHGKEARKMLKQPELANAPAVSANQPAGQPQQ